MHTHRNNSLLSFCGVYIAPLASRSPNTAPPVVVGISRKDRRKGAEMRVRALAKAAVASDESRVTKA